MSTDHLIAPRRWTRRLGAFAATAVAASALVLAPVSPVSAASEPFYVEDFSTGTGNFVPFPGTSVIVHNAGDATMTIVSGGAFTNFDGRRSEWPGDYYAEAIIYLDPTWPEGTGFDWSVASNNPAGIHRRDFIFNVGVTNNGLRVIGRNNSDGFANASVLNGAGSVEITTAGWYTFRHYFRDDAGVLAVDMSVADSGGALVYETTRTDATDVIDDTVGGNRYGWFIFASMPGGLTIDEVRLCSAVGNCVSPTAVERKQAVIDELAGLLPTGDNKADKEIEKAITAIEKSIDPKFWADDDTPEKDKVFNEERKAVQALMKAEETVPAVADAIDTLVAIDRQFAVNAIDAAAGGDQKRLDKADEALAKGDAEEADGNFDKAINEYKKAWKEANKA